MRETIKIGNASDFRCHVLSLKRSDFIHLYLYKKLIQMAVSFDNGTLVCQKWTKREILLHYLPVHCTLRALCLMQGATHYSSYMVTKCFYTI